MGILARLAGVLVGAVCFAQAQHAGHAVASALPVMVDGSKSPELISNELAYRHFILSVAEHANPSEMELERRASRLRPIGLNEQDKQLLTLALSNLREELDAVNNNRLPAGGDVTNLTTFLNTERSSLDSARRAIKGKISAQGQVLLDAFVFLNVKKGIVIYGTN